MPIYSKRKSASRKLRGGSGGASWAESVYGSANQQTNSGEIAGGNTNNAIAMNGGSGLVGGGKSATITGGKRYKKKGGNLTDLAVPAVLLVANQMYKRKTNKFRGSRSRRRFSRRVRGGNAPEKTM